MSDNNDGNPAGAPILGDPNATGSQLALQAVYLKDCSYEAPNGPRVDGQWNPQINLDLHTGVNILTPELREIVLTVTVSARQRRRMRQITRIARSPSWCLTRRAAARTSIRGCWATSCRPSSSNRS